MSLEIVEQNGFTSYEFDSRNEAENCDLDITLDKDVLAVFVAIEGEAIVSIGERDLLEDDQALARSKDGQQLYLKANPAENFDGETELSVKAKAEVGGRLRALIIVIRRGIRLIWNKLKCPACKKLVRMLLMALLTGGADAPLHLIWPDTDLRDLIPLPKFPDLLAMLDKICAGYFDDLPPALVSLFSKVPELAHIIAAIRHFLEDLDELLDLMDRFLTAVCRRMGMCH